jgi:hypothetical protein
MGKYLCHAALAALIAVVAAQGKWLTTGASAQNAAQAQGRELPVFEVDKSWPKVPPQWKLGDVSSINADLQGNIYIIHRPRTLKDPDFAQAAPPVLVFDPDGNFLRAWGGDGPGYEWPQREHGIYIDPKGFVWIGGINCPTNGQPRVKPVWDDQILKFTTDGKFVMQIGHSNQSKGNADTGNLRRPSDASYYAPTNEMFFSDGYGNRRVIVFDHDTGAFKRMWGAFGNKPEDDERCEPSASAASALRKPDFTPPGPQQFSLVHSVRVSNDGMVYVADRENRRVQSFTVAGAYVKQLIKGDTPFARSVALSPDPEQKFLYVGNGDSIAIIDRKSLELIGQIKPPGAIGGGHLIGTDPKGNIYVAATTGGMQKLTYKGLTSPAVR